MGERKVRYLSLEEGGFSLLLLAAAIFCLVIAGKTWDQVLAFHTALIALASLTGIFFIFRRYFDGSNTPAPLEINGKPNYNMGPVKFTTWAAVFWGIAGFLVGVIIASQLAFPALNFDLPWTNFGVFARCIRLL